MPPLKHWPKYKGYPWEVAPFLRILLPITLGILLYNTISQYTTMHSVTRLWALFMLCACSFASACIVQSSYMKFRLAPTLFFFLMQIGWIVLSFNAAYLNDIRTQDSWFGNYTTADEACLVRLLQDPDVKEKSFRTEVNVIASLNKHKLYPRCGNSLLYIYKGPAPCSIHKGDTLIIPAHWMKIEQKANPYDFNYTALLARRGIYFQQFVPPKKVGVYAKGNPADMSFTENIHSFCQRQLEKYITDTTSCSLAEAMLLGDEQKLNKPLLGAYAATGIVHIIAISGGNVGVLFMLISFVLGMRALHAKPWLKYALSILPVWLYVIMAGSGPSAVRAAMMFTITAVGFIFNKRSNGLNQLMATASLLLLAEPSWLFSLGFQLSFIAVLSILLFYGPVLSLFKPGAWLFRKLWELIAASLAAEVLVAPLVVYYFHLFPLSFLLANVAAFIFMSIVLIAAILVIVFSGLPFLAQSIANLCSYIIVHFNSWIFTMQHLNPHQLNVLVLDGFSLILVYAIITFLAAYFIRNYKIGLSAAGILACIFLAYSCLLEFKYAAQRKFIVFKSPKGSAIYLLTGHNYVNLSRPDTSITISNLPGFEALCHWRAWYPLPALSQNVFSFHGNKVLLLNAPIVLHDSFPVDYLIINFDLNAGELRKLDSCFRAKEIVLAYNNGAKSMQNCYEMALLHHIPLYNPTYQGAFILQAY